MRLVHEVRHADGEPIEGGANPSEPEYPWLGSPPEDHPLREMRIRTGGVVELGDIDLDGDVLGPGFRSETFAVDDQATALPLRERDGSAHAGLEALEASITPGALELDERLASEHGRPDRSRDAGLPDRAL